MAPTIPICDRATAAGTTLQDVFTEYYTFLDANPGDFVIENLVGGGSPTSFTLTHTSGFQINYRITGGQLLYLEAPQGGITDSAAPGSPTNGSPEKIALPAIAGIGTDVLLAQYGDATFLGLKSAAGTECPYMFHHGVLATPNNGNSSSYGNTGLSGFAYIPDTTFSGSNVLFSTTSSDASRQSLYHCGGGNWGTPTSMIIPTVNDIGVGDEDRFYPIPLHVAADLGRPATTDRIRGWTKYFRYDAETIALPFTVVPSAGTDQAWLRINDTASTSSSKMCILWNKTVTP